MALLPRSTEIQPYVAPIRPSPPNRSLPPTLISFPFQPPIPEVRDARPPSRPRRPPSTVQRVCRSTARTMPVALLCLGTCAIRSLALTCAPCSAFNQTHRVESSRACVPCLVPSKTLTWLPTCLGPNLPRCLGLGPSSTRCMWLVPRTRVKARCLGLVPSHCAFALCQDMIDACALCQDMVHVPCAKSSQVMELVPRTCAKTSCHDALCHVPCAKTSCMCRGVPSHGTCALCLVLVPRHGVKWPRAKSWGL